MEDSSEKINSSENGAENPQTYSLKGWLKGEMSRMGNNYVNNLKEFPWLVGPFTALVGLSLATGAGAVTGEPGVMLGALAAELAIPVFTVKTGVREAKNNN